MHAHSVLYFLLAGRPKKHPIHLRSKKIEEKLRNKSCKTRRIPHWVCARSYLPGDPHKRVHFEGKTKNAIAATKYL